MWRVSMCWERTSTAVLGLIAADRRCRARSLVVVVGRHAHVDDREVRRVLADEGEQHVGVAGPSDDAVARVLEQPRETLAQQHGVLRDHDAHGSSTAIRVPAPAGLCSARVPPCAATRSARPARPVPAVGAAPPIPSSATTSWSTPSLRAAQHGDPRRRGVLERVGQRLAGDEVRDRLDLGRCAIAGGLHLDGHRRSAGEVLERGREPLVQPRRAHAGGERAQVRDRRRHLVHRGVERRLEDLRLPGQRTLQPPEHDPERDEPLLRPVVQIALDPAALRVPRLGDPRARGLHLRRAGAAARPATGRARPRRPPRRARRAGDPVQRRCRATARRRPLVAAESPTARDRHRAVPRPAGRGDRRRCRSRGAGSGPRRSDRRGRARSRRRRPRARCARRGPRRGSRGAAGRPRSARGRSGGRRVSCTRSRSGRKASAAASVATDAANAEPLASIPARSATSAYVPASSAVSTA